MSEAHDGYAATIEYLYSRLPMFSRIGAAAIKADLTNTIALCSALDNPQRRFPAIHIAGTNGKGSTSHMLAAILCAAGYKTGLYTSPHLADFRERIRIDGKPVSQSFVVDFVAQHKGLIEAVHPSFFEITVAMAFAAFAATEVDIAVIETGLGGRLDSTNVVTPVLSIITNISLDHTDLLGKDIPSIAREKAGIIKPEIPVVLGKLLPEALEVMHERALQMQSPILSAADSWTLSEAPEQRAGLRSYKALHAQSNISRPVVTDLTGSYQQENIATVLCAVDVLKSLGWAISWRHIQASLSHVKSATGLRGRWEILADHPLIIADVAHNPAGLSAVLADWQRISAPAKHVLLGFVRDKDVQAALQLFPKDSLYHFCAANTPRALPADELSAIAEGVGIKGEVYLSIKAAIAGVSRVLADDDALLIIGSFYVVGEALEALGASS